MDSTGELRRAMQRARQDRDDEVATRLMTLAAQRHVLGHHDEAVTIGRFTALRTLGRGSSGLVLEAYDPKLERKVALKAVDRGSLGSHGLSEARALARLNHPNVVTLFEVDQYDDGYVLVMELVDGHNLGEWLDEQARTTRELMKVLLEVGEGLAAAHEAKIVHRDIKPSNVVIDVSGRPRLIDFGLASAPTPPSRSSGGSEDTSSGLVGTPAYMAPEQLAGRRGDAGSDQYSYCVMAYEVLVGHRPFLGTTLEELAAAQASPVPFPRRRRIAKRTRKALARGLSQRPEDRFASMNDLLSEMRPRPLRALYVSGATAAVIVAGFAAWGRGDQARCVLDDPEIPGWGSSQRNAVRNAIFATGSSYADQTWTNVERSLDGWVSAWREAYQSSCRRVEERGLTFGESAIHRCLERHSTAFRIIVDALDPLETDEVWKASRVVAELPDVSSCLDPEPRAAGLSAEDPDAQCEERLTRAAAQRALGNYEVQGRLARECEERADALGLPFEGAKARVEVGDAQHNLGNPEQAQEAFSTAFHAALERDYDAVTADAAFGLALVAEARRKPEDGLVWARTAEVLYRKLEDEARTRATLLRSRLEELRGNGPAAIEILDEIIDGAGPDTAPGLLASAHHARGNAKANLGQYREALADYERSSEFFTRSFGSAHPNVVFAQVGIGTSQMRLGETQEAIKILTEAAARVGSMLGSNHPARAAALTNLALAHAEANDLERVLEIQREVLEIQRRTFGEESVQVGSSTVNIATTLVGLERFEDALEALRGVRTIYERPEASEERSTLFFWISLCDVNANIERYRDAVEAISHASRIASETLPPEHPLHDSIRLRQGTLYVEVGRTEAALQLLEAGPLDDSMRPDSTVGIIARLTLAYLLRAFRRDLDRASKLRAEADRRLRDADSKTREAIERWRSERGW